MKNCLTMTLTLALLSVPTLVNAAVCEYADATATKITTGVAGVGVGAGVLLKAAGVTAIAHSSGAAIAATASSGYLAGTLGAVGAAVGVITAPVTLVIGGVAVAAAGGTIAYCHFKDNKNAPPAPAGSASNKAK